MIFPAFYDLSQSVSIVAINAVIPYGADDKYYNPGIIQAWNIGQAQDLVLQTNRILQGPTSAQQQQLQTGKEEQPKQAMLKLLWPFFEAVEQSGGMHSLYTGGEYEMLQRTVAQWTTMQDAFDTWFGRLSVTGRADAYRRVMAKTMPVFNAYRHIPRGIGRRVLSRQGHAGPKEEVAKTIALQLAEKYGPTVVEKGLPLLAERVVAPAANWIADTLGFSAGQDMPAKAGRTEGQSYAGGQSCSFCHE